MNRCDSSGDYPGAGSATPIFAVRLKYRIESTVRPVGKVEGGPFNDGPSRP